MHRSSLLFALLLVTYVNYGQSITLQPGLPIGEYHINVYKILPCDPLNKNIYQFNLYLNKVSAKLLEFKGNVTMDSLPFDDNTTFHAQLDSRDSMGRWSPSSLSMKKEKACTTIKSFIKTEYLDSMGWNGTCPTPPGVIIVPGFIATNVDKALKNIPKVAPYGTYKVRSTITDKKNECIACFHFLMEIKRP